MHFQNSNFKHKMKILQILQKLVHEKFYLHEIAAVNLSKIYLLKNTKKTCKRNNRDLNRDWKGIVIKRHFWLSFSRLFLFIRSWKFIIVEMHLRYSALWERDEPFNHSKCITGSAWKQPPVFYSKSCPQKFHNIKVKIPVFGSLFNKEL